MVIEGKKVCVTGANGYIASWIIKLLLERGYTVNATVRCLNEPKKTDHLLALGGAKERLKLFEASLSTEGSFDDAIQGCDGVFHTASPVKFEAPNPEEEIVAPALKGTLNVLASCAKFRTVKRVVVTSSMAAVMINGKPLNPDVVIDETWWSVPELCEYSPMKWYLLSKTLAEKAAWDFTKSNGIDMVSINPAICTGPFLQSEMNGSVHYISDLINGSEIYMNASFGWVHVKDVAEAHILAFENPAAHGRYLMTESVAHMTDIIKILRELYPNLKLPTRCADDNPPHPLYQISKEKIHSLGLKYIPLKDAIKDTIECFKEKKSSLFSSELKTELKK